MAYGLKASSCDPLKYLSHGYVQFVANKNPPSLHTHFVPPLTDNKEHKDIYNIYFKLKCEIFKWPLKI